MQPQTLTGQASLVTPSRKRFFIMVLLFITVVINYWTQQPVDRRPALTSELGIDPIHVGLIFSAFGWTYAAMQIPGGWLVDRVPPRILYTAALLLWSIATVMLGLPPASSRCSSCAWPSAPGSAGLSDQQPRGDDVVPGTRARHGHRFLHVWAVCRPGIPDAVTGLAATNSAGTWCLSPPAR
jgi:MFS family permease